MPGLVLRAVKQNGGFLQAFNSIRQLLGYAYLMLLLKLIFNAHTISSFTVKVGQDSLFRGGLRADKI